MATLFWQARLSTFVDLLTGLADGATQSVIKTLLRDHDLADAVEGPEAAAYGYHVTPLEQGE